jgi:hypothetical protein
MVQFIGPVQDDWLAALQSAGLETVAYLPDNAYVVWGQQPGLRLADLAARENFIEWTGEYRPEYRLSSALAAQISDQPALAAATRMKLPAGSDGSALPAPRRAAQPDRAYGQRHSSAAPA